MALSKKKALLAASIAGLIATGVTLMTPSAQAEGTSKDVACNGINKCKAMGMCAGKSGNSCAGKNACKGAGVVMVSQAACDAIGGTTA